MEKIILKHTLPEVFANGEMGSSDIWREEVSFTRESVSLIRAASGTGKSSLLSYIFGYREDYQGEILFDEKDIKDITPNVWNDIRRKEISIMFQELRLFDELSALDNIIVKNKLTHHKTRKDVELWFERLGIADKMFTPVNRLSYGQRQRVAFIRSLCQPFQFILLDEPISHLDEANSRAVADLLLEEATAQGAGVIVTSLGHQLDLPYSNYYNL